MARLPPERKAGTGSVMDTMPAWFAITAPIVCTVLWLWLEFRSAPIDGRPELSRLDRLDGLDTRG